MCPFPRAIYPSGFRIIILYENNKDIPGLIGGAQRRAEGAGRHHCEHKPDPVPARHLCRPGDIAGLLNCLARSYKANNQPAEARDYFRQAAEKYRELGNEKQAQANLDEMNKC